MMSFSLNKKIVIIFNLVIPLVVTNYATAVCDLRMENVQILHGHSNNTYYPGDKLRELMGFANNIGDEKSNTIYIDIYVGEYLIKTYKCDSVAWPGEAEGLSPGTDCTLPSDIPPGNYTFWMKLRCSNDINPDNNTDSATPDIIIVEPPPPPPVVDLWIPVVNALSPWGTDLFNQGGEIKFECSIGNIGNTISESYVVNFTVGDYLISSVSEGPLAPDETVYIETDPSIIPLNISNGTYVVTATVVCPNETITDNNIRHPANRIRIAMPFQDISVTNVAASGYNYKPGDSIFIQTTIKNNGTFTAENITADFYLGEDIIGSTLASDLNPELTETFNAECKIPDNLTDGYYTVKAVVSCTDDKNANNNEMSSDNTFWVGRKSDVMVQSVNAVNGTYMPRDTLTIYSLVKNIGDAKSRVYTIDFYLSADNVITVQDFLIGHLERNAMEPNEQHSYNTTFKLPPNTPASNFYVGVKVICNEDNNFANNTGYDNETISIIHPANYVYGKVTYAYPNYNDQAYRYAMVRIFDKNSSGTDRKIGQTYTDENGNYGVVVTSDSQSSQNIYLIAYTESGSGVYPGTISKICTVKDSTLQAKYVALSSSYQHPQNLSQMINLKCSAGPFMVFDSMVEGFLQAKTFFNAEMEEITAAFPSADNGTYFYPGNGIWIGNGDEMDRDVILHEYGHYIAEVYDFAQGSVGNNGTHSWDKDLRSNPVARTAQQAANLGFREAWPTFYSIACQLDDYTYPNAGDTKYQDFYSGYKYTYQFDLEMDTFANRSPGEFFDNMNCCLLWDIFDNNPDHPINFNEMVTDPNMSRIWTIMRGYKPEDMNDFWIGWNHCFGQNNDIVGVNNIFKKHRMTFAESGQSPVLPQNHAPVAAAGPDMVVSQSKAEGAQVHLDGSGSSDLDGDSLSYIWRSGYITHPGIQLDIVLPVGQNVLELEVSDGKITTWDTLLVTVTPTSPGSWH